MTISPSATAECKRILAIHIYRYRALLPALATAFIQFVRFHRRPFAINALFHSLPPCSSFLSLFLSLRNSPAISLVSLPVSAPPFCPLFRRLFAATFNTHCRLRRSRRCRRQSAAECRRKGRREREEREREAYAGIEAFVRARPSARVARKNICVIIYYLERKIEIFRARGGAPETH